jgi:cysteine desulfurase family protein (TIGR01976 family)
MPLNTKSVRKQFPGLARDAIFLDNPAGTQVAQHCLDRVQDYLTHTNANTEGYFATSLESDAVLDDARAAVADFLGAGEAGEIVFGPNMTSLTYQFSRLIGRQWLQPGDAIVVTHMDHDGNVSPWVQMAAACGCEVIQVPFDVASGSFDPAAFEEAFARGPKLVAFGYASNVLGTINPAADIVRMAREAGALSYVDAVQYAPHGPIDVQALDCDFLVCSAYKFFGPHAGMLHGKAEHLEALQPDKLRPAPSERPYKFENGTQNHEGIAGILGALEYFLWLGEHAGLDLSGDRRANLHTVMHAVAAEEQALSKRLLDRVAALDGATIYGPTGDDRLAERVPTVSFRLEGIAPSAIVKHLAQNNIFAWSGNAYGLAVTEHLGVEEQGGIVRLGATHYNTEAEINATAEVLEALIAQPR